MDLPPNLDVIQEPATAYCMVSASHRFQLPPESLLSLALVEGGSHGTVARNTNQTADLGIMQINTVWLTDKSPLKGYVTASELMYDTCKNIHSAAWILATNIKRSNGDIWRAVGMYHSPGNQTLARNYMLKVNNKLPLARHIISQAPVYQHFINVFYRSMAGRATGQATIGH